MDKSGDKSQELWMTQRPNMFIGEYHHTIDEKGRVAIPVKFRTALKQGSVVTRGLDHCLAVYPKKEWDQLAARLAAMPIANANSRAFARFMLAGAMELEFDSQGRALLPDYLRQYASIGKKAVVAGLSNRLEIWDDSAWEKYRSGTDKSSNDIAEALGDLGV